MYKPFRGTLRNTVLIIKAPIGRSGTQLSQLLNLDLEVCQVILLVLDFGFRVSSYVF